MKKREMGAKGAAGTRVFIRSNEMARRLSFFFYFPA
jgi:hypothetical protein